MWWILFALLLVPSPVMALEITEIAYDLVGTDEDHEWVELYNAAAEPVDLTGFLFVDGTGKHKISFGDQAVIIPAGSYAILSDNATVLTPLMPASTVVFDTVMSLPNYSSTRTEAIALQLLYPNGQTVAEAAYLPAKDISAGVTLEKRADGQWGKSVAGGTPGKPAGEVVPIAHIGGIRISEILPNPAGEDSDNEWIELENTTDSEIDVSLWYVADKPTASGQIKTITFPEKTIIPKGGFYVQIVKGSVLNNEDEEVTLFWPDGEAIQKVSLAGKAKDNHSFSLIGQDFAWTDRATAGEANKPMTVVEKASTEKTSEKIEPASVSTANKGLAGSTTVAVPKNTNKESIKDSEPARVSTAELAEASKRTDSSTGAKLTINKNTAPESPSTSPEANPSTSLHSLEGEGRVVGLSTDRQAGSWRLALFWTLGAIVIGLFALALAAYRYKLIRLLVHFPLLKNQLIK